MDPEEIKAEAAVEAIRRLVTFTGAASVDDALSRVIETTEWVNQLAASGRLYVKEEDGKLHEVTPA